MKFKLIKQKSPQMKYPVNYFILQVVRPSSTVQLKSRIISSCPPSSQRLSIWSAHWPVTRRSKCSKEPGASQYHQSGPDVSVTADCVWTGVISGFCMCRGCLAVQRTIGCFCPFSLCLNRWAVSCVSTAVLRETSMSPCQSSSTSANHLAPQGASFSLVAASANGTAVQNKVPPMFTH